MKRRELLTAFVAAACCANAAVAAAQAPAEPAPTFDVGDLWRAVRHRPTDDDARTADERRRTLTMAPVIGSSPSTGATFGAAAQLAFFGGRSAETRISSGLASLTVSTKRQIVFNARHSIFGDQNRWFTQGDQRLHRTSQDTYAFGTASDDGSKVNARYNLVRVHQVLYWRLPGSQFLGGGLRVDSHTDVHPADGEEEAWATSSYVTYSEAHGFDLDSQQSGGFSVDWQLDTRDSHIAPLAGWLLGASYRFAFDGFLGGDSAWQSVHLEARTYKRLPSPRPQRLAFWFYTDLVTSGTPPYFDLPTTVMDVYGRSARAYREGRYRGERLMYGEVEYRGPITSNGLLGFVVFTNATTIASAEAQQELFDSVAPAFGGGIRLLLSKRSRTNLCFDVGIGKDGARGVYFAIQEAF